MERTDERLYQSLVRVQYPFYVSMSLSLSAVLYRGFRPCFTVF